jgi:hypothetical protein
LLGLVKWRGVGVFGVKLHCGKVNCTYGGGEKTRNQTWRCISDPLLACRLKIPSDKNRALPCNRNFLYEMLPKSVQWEPSFSLRTGRRTDGRTCHDEATSHYLRLSNTINTTLIMLKILGAAVQKIVARTTTRPVFVHLCYTQYLWIESSMLTAYERNYNAIHNFLWPKLGMPRVGFARTLPNDLQVCLHVTNLNRFLVAYSL